MEMHEYEQALYDAVPQLAKLLADVAQEFDYPTCHMTPMPAQAALNVLAPACLRLIGGVAMQAMLGSFDSDEMYDLEAKWHLQIMQDLANGHKGMVGVKYAHPNPTDQYDNPN